MTTLEDRIKEKARFLGFELVGIAEAGEAETYSEFIEWLNKDHAGEMDYMVRHGRARQHPSSILSEVRSVVMVGVNYKSERSESGKDGSLAGKVATYAQGRDYHDVLRRKLNELLAWLQTEVPDCNGRGVVDTAPLLERDFARRAGLGWFGKNTMLVNKEIGSYFLLGALLVNIPLQPDGPHTSNHCGTCTACLDACPTHAFVGAGELDSRRCISYLTIELKGSIVEELREPMGDWFFGCDICQEVCPWNRKAPLGADTDLLPRAELQSVDLVELFRLPLDSFRDKFQGTALTRPKRRGLLRNAAIVLGNLGDPAALPVLRVAAVDEDAVIREAAQWAIAQIEQNTLASGEEIEITRE